MPEPRDPSLSRLEADGLLRLDGGVPRTTRRLQAALARAALNLYGRGGDGADAGDDLRVPLAFALVELYGSELPDERLASFVEALLPIEEAELSPAIHMERQERTTSS